MRILTILFILIISVIPASSETIRIGYFQAAPYVFKDDSTNMIKGATYDYIREKIEPLMGVTFKWSKMPYPIARLLKQLENGEMDAAAMFAKNKEREKHFVYPGKPYFVSPPNHRVKKR